MGNLKSQQKILLATCRVSEHLELVAQEYALTESDIATVILTLKESLPTASLIAAINETQSACQDAQ